MKGFGYALSALAGAVAGGVAVHFFEKKKNEAFLYNKQQEISKYWLEKIQNDLGDSDQGPICETDAPKPAEEVYISTVDVEPVPVVDYEEVVTMYDTETKEEKKEERKLPYPIAANQFGKSGNEEVLLTYYADGVLVDEDYRVVPEDDILEFVGGRNFVKWFGEYGEMGTVHVRNDDLNTDFEIDQDPRNWRDFKKSMPSFPTGRGPFDDNDTTD